MGTESKDDPDAPEFRQVHQAPVLNLMRGAVPFTLDFDLMIRQCAEGKRGAWARLYNFSAQAMREGYALPNPLNEFLAQRLAEIGRLLGDGDPIDNVWRNKLAIAVKGKRLARNDLRRFNKNIARSNHLMNKILGLSASESDSQTANELHISAASVKRLRAPSSTRKSGGKTRRIKGEA